MPGGGCRGPGCLRGRASWLAVAVQRVTLGLSDLKQQPLTLLTGSVGPDLGGAEPGQSEVLSRPATVSGQHWGPLRAATRLSLWAGQTGSDGAGTAAAPQASPSLSSLSPSPPATCLPPPHRAWSPAWLLRSSRASYRGAQLSKVFLEGARQEPCPLSDLPGKPHGVTPTALCWSEQPLLQLPVWGLPMLWGLTSFSRSPGPGECGLHHHRVHRGRDDGVRLVEGLAVPGGPAVLRGHPLPSGVVSAGGGGRARVCLEACLCAAWQPSPPSPTLESCRASVSETQLSGSQTGLNRGPQWVPLELVCRRGQAVAPVDHSAETGPENWAET